MREEKEKISYIVGKIEKKYNVNCNIIELTNSYYYNNSFCSNCKFYNKNKKVLFDCSNSGVGYLK